MSLLKRCMVNCPITITLFLFISGYYIYLETHPYATTLKLALSVIFHVLLVLSLSSLFITLILSPGIALSSFDPSTLPDELKVFYNEDYSEIDFSLSRVTFCKKCEIYRPPRCHHCSTCEKCVLRYEHHCPFVGNCIGFSTQKPFILFLVYTSLSILILNVFIIWKISSSYSTLWLVILVVYSALFVFETGFALSQLAMVAENVTSLEMSWSHRVFDTGSKLKNFEEVFGQNWGKWFFPCFTEQGGENFAVRIRLKSKGLHLIEGQYLI